MDTVICYLGNTQELCSILTRDSRLQKADSGINEPRGMAYSRSGEKKLGGGGIISSYVVN